MKTFVHSLQSEWLKTRHSAASWLVVCGGFFIPLILTIVQVFYPEQISPSIMAPHFWESLFLKSWESMAFLLLPVGVILATSLITQIEYKNNTWKQVLATPQSLLTVFLAKYAVVIILLAQFFLLFTLGYVASGYLPSLLNGTFDFPKEAFPWFQVLKQSGCFFLTALPLLAIQYLISLRFRNFLVSIGFGLAMVIASIFVLQWKFGYLMPFAYTSKHYMAISHRTMNPGDEHIYLLSLGYFILVTLVSYIIFIRRRENT